MANEEHLELINEGVDAWNKWRREHAGTRPDLREAKLSGANLSTANLYGAYLIGAHLNQANLIGADLSGTHLGQANLNTANLHQANLTGAHLNQANLSEANLSEANLSGAHLGQANLQGANLHQANLSGAHLNQANLIRADVSRADLIGADLRGANLFGAWLAQANLSGVNGAQANLSGAYLNSASFNDANLTFVRFSEGTILDRANFSQANFSRAWLMGANFKETNLSGANLSEANLMSAALFWNVNLSGAKLCGANLQMADLSGANLSGADLSGANLTRVRLIETNLENANLNGCRIYGISAWNMKVNQQTKQSDLIITGEGLATVKVDDIQVAQFIHLILKYENLRNVLNAVTKRGVLILGRFGGGGVEVLRELGEALRQSGYLPMIFEFERPEDRNYTETMQTLAGLSRFVVVDLSGPSVPAELSATVPHLKIPFVPILEKGRHPYSMFADLLENEHMLPIVEFDSVPALIQELQDKIVSPAEKRIATRQAKLKEIFG